jgi:hypothetical protein
MSSVFVASQSRCFFTVRAKKLEHGKMQRDWLATNTDDIIAQSHSRFVSRHVENRTGKTMK